jgi:hypothetical protein
MIDEFTVMAAAHAGHYQYYGDWQLLSWQEKAKIVAYYLLNLLVESHKEDAVASALEKKNKSKK